MGEKGTVEEVLARQREYYDLRAPDFDDSTKPTDRRSRGGIGAATARELLDGLAPFGDVLELACGTGAFTRELVRHARTLTCVDGSPQMLERHRELVAGAPVERVCADLFAWRPARAYDEVVFGYWLSHVPPPRFDEFWDLVASCLRPGGRAVFVDEDRRGVVHEAERSEGAVPTARRRLADGRTFDIVKVFWAEADLEQRLQALGWEAQVRPVGDSCYLGVARRRKG
jgi:demethylmenaquinone methyltransferase/2-methoxy-6-polyprenyl-1,4-benzoquinol methylase